MPINDPYPFQLSDPDSVLDDLRQRLLRPRLLEAPSLDPGATGTSVVYIKPLLDYWREVFDWRSQAAKANAIRRFTVPIALTDSPADLAARMGKSW